jgi:hypothetical protein
MSDTDRSSDSILPEPLRTVTPPSGTHPDESMNIIGWLMLAGLLVVLTPIIPLIGVVWLLSKATDALRPS